MKYIDADKLRSVLQNTINSMKEKDVKGERYDAFLNGKLSICEELLGCIASLQQEQPEEARYNTLTGQYGEILETHAMWECIAAVGAKLSKDGNMYCFLLGDNIQEGVCGFGKTIFEAALDFYTNIKTEEARKEE